MKPLLVTGATSPSPNWLRAGTPRTRQHWVAEQVLDWTGIGASHLRFAASRSARH
ncbi:hypothetical protein [Nocardia iowensis]|uniref:Uncharacterized protein n=1 Tax=Nocardia iowensis TaxID=204891 RepID=A0ABX8RF17_NOCIO|nr:hypothetical protein [Nocardia iowensis]QXN88195.1 hypothetical protein KV110_21500 [Nocardia iowensis]